MPRKNSPNTLKIGTGVAGVGSVNASALTFQINTGAPTPSATAIRVNTPPLLSGTSVQTTFNGVNALAPLPHPNRLGSDGVQIWTTVPNAAPAGTYKNTGIPVVTPTPAEGTFTDPVLGTVGLVNTQNIVVSGIIYPADRGVLAIRLDGTFVAALDLDVIFVEGSPEDTDPSRVVGQDDYTAGDNLGATVDSLPQMNLIDRLPATSDYTRALFPHLPPGDDPVYDAFTLDYASYQLGKYSVTVDLGATEGTKGTLLIVHLKSRQDYENAKASNPYEAWGEVELYSPIVFDTDVVATPTITSYTLTSNVTLQPVTPRYLSGIAYYGPDDEFTLNWGATGLYADSYLLDAARLQMLGTGDQPVEDMAVFQYSPGTILKSSVSTYSYANYIFTDSAPFPDPAAPFTRYVLHASPSLQVRDPFNRVDTEAFVGNPFLLHYGYVGAQTVAEETSENFENENARYAHDDLGSAIWTADATGSTWDPSLTLDYYDLQVRGIVPAHIVPEGVTGGELAWPNINYSTGFYPTTTDGSTAQLDYSALPTDPTLFRGGRRFFFRTFEMGSPRSTFAVRITGHPTADNTLAEDLFLNDDEGNITGVEMGSILLDDAEFANWLVPVEAGGCLVDFIEESPYSVLIQVTLPQPPVAEGSDYPLPFFVAMLPGKPAAMGGLFALYRIDVLSSAESISEFSYGAV